MKTCKIFLGYRLPLTLLFASAIYSKSSAVRLLSQLRLNNLKPLFEEQIRLLKGQAMLQTFELHFVRHGETVANRDHILQGHCDYPLTEDGINQALMLGEKLANIEYAAAYSSDLPRARRTAEMIIGKRVAGTAVKPITIDSLRLTELIREASFGIRDGLPRSYTMQQAAEAFALKNNISLKDVVDTAELPQDLLHRQNLFLEKLWEDSTTFDIPALSTGSNQDGSMLQTAHPPKILVVSHGAFIRHFLQNFSPHVAVKKIANCSLTVVTMTKVIDKDGKTAYFRCSADAENVNKVFN